MTPFLPVDSLDSPRFCGVPTFMRLPEARPGDRMDAAILGLPSDSGAPYRTGARFGPGAIRAMSVMLRPINPYRGHVNVFERLAIADAGDASVVPGYLEDTFVRLEAAIDALVGSGVVPIALGGDHSVSLAALRSLARAHGPLSLVHFDAHSDTWRSYFAGKTISAGTPFRRAVEEGIVDPGSSIQLGMRGSLFRADDVSQSVDLGYAVLTTDEIMALGADAVADRVAGRVGDRPVYLTFDLDFVDPSGAPGVQTPEAGGPTTREALAFLRALPSMRLVGGDVVEVNPLYDGPGQITALLGATVALELLSLLAISSADETT
jgi:agmatinase